LIAAVHGPWESLRIAMGAAQIRFAADWINRRTIFARMTMTPMKMHCVLAWYRRTSRRERRKEEEK